MGYKNARGIIDTGDSAEAVRALRGHGDEVAATERQEGMMNGYEFLTVLDDMADVHEDGRTDEARNYGNMLVLHVEELRDQLAAMASRAEAAEAQLAAALAELAQVDLGEWEDEELREWLPAAAMHQLNERYSARLDNVEDEIAQLRVQLDAAQVENKRLAAAFREASNRAAKAEDGFLMPIVVRPTFEVDWDEFGDAPAPDTP